MDTGPRLLIWDLLELSAKLLLVDKRSGGCKEQAVKCISTRLCGCSESDTHTHTGNDLELTGYLRRKEVMEMC